MDRLDELIPQIRDFALERDWTRFHTPKNLAMAVSGEAGELIAELQWMTDEEVAESLNQGGEMRAGWRQRWRTC